MFATQTTSYHYNLLQNISTKFPFSMHFHNLLSSANFSIDILDYSEYNNFLSKAILQIHNFALGNRWEIIYKQDEKNNKRRISSVCPCLFAFLF